ncbi:MULTISPECIES: hypothetical protein [Pseudoalteromonas]|uniref:Uncharacterized protein n=1 Tax=Pseudoalteromonas luteoviolacea (strain 2ta16) TaxID=1353533 RepID=V4HSR4_PSEL2|nr:MULTISPECIES: hypothetical protein [Pseudoalteromonas]ESP92803.1 hypothetical protein PL2TA16_04001 [Pseudoalteromonas luteoviolacea 2ta16]KZN35614.1 hypothetical protein N483_01255 [Pseudoalteromonas luteoviolacea NCIMB 1944]MCG7546424.1 hypothetical protein [Pseudoalteromonas sp. Of7M-16]
MKLTIKKNKLKDLTKNDVVISDKVTPQIGGALPPASHFCDTKGQCNTHTWVTFYCH